MPPGLCSAGFPLSFLRFPAIGQLTDIKYVYHLKTTRILGNSYTFCISNFILFLISSWEVGGVDVEVRNLGEKMIWLPIFFFSIPMITLLILPLFERPALHVLVELVPHSLFFRRLEAVVAWDTQNLDKRDRWSSRQPEISAMSCLTRYRVTI